ncbi:MAG: hypothetical protein KDJ41_13105, partial [Hyphomicrobiaceae bacterium]|nr:hypothetical protein [Hyphomicrobiaceae bacterium]
SGGDTISPQHIENQLALEPEIEAAMVVGDNRPHLVAIIVPAKDFIAEWAAHHGKRADLAELAGEPTFRAAVARAVERTNGGLPSVERVKRFVVADQPFTIENGMMTPTMKPRRHAILSRWGATLDGLY